MTGLLKIACKSLVQILDSVFLSTCSLSIRTGFVFFVDVVVVGLIDLSTSAKKKKKFVHKFVFTKPTINQICAHIWCFLSLFPFSSFCPSRV